MQLTIENWQSVDRIARELAASTDRNELGKVITFFQRTKNKTKFLRLLERLPQSGYIRSNQTRAYLTRIRDVCSSELDDVDDKRAIEILGWAFRRMTYYQTLAGKGTASARLASTSNQRIVASKPLTVHPEMPKPPMQAEIVQEKKVDVFLCYALGNTDKARKIYSKLSAWGLKPWMADKDLLPNEKWEVGALQAIRQSRVFLACLSRDVLTKKGALQKEIQDALDMWNKNGQTNSCVVLVQLEECPIPEALRSYAAIKLFDPDGWEKLKSAIETSK